MREKSSISYCALCILSICSCFFFSFYFQCTLIYGWKFSSVSFFSCYWFYICISFHVKKCIVAIVSVYMHVTMTMWIFTVQHFYWHCCCYWCHTNHTLQNTVNVETIMHSTLTSYTHSHTPTCMIRTNQILNAMMQARGNSTCSLPCNTFQIKQFQVTFLNYWNHGCQFPFVSEWLAESDSMDLGDTHCTGIFYLRLLTWKIKTKWRQAHIFG